MRDEEQFHVMDDERVIGEILSGKADLFRVLVSRYANDVLHIVGRVVTKKEDAEEVVQDTFVAVYRNLSTYDRKKASFRTWLMRIAYYNSLKRLRERYDEPWIVMEQDYAETIPDVDVQQMMNDTSSHRLLLLELAIGQLSARDRMLLSLYYYDDRPMKDIAFITGTTETYLRSRMQWLRKKLCQTIKNLEKNGNKES